MHFQTVNLNDQRRGPTIAHAADYSGQCSIGSMSHTDHHCHINHCLATMTDCSHPPCPAPTKAKGLRFFHSSCSALLIFELSHRTSPHPLSHGTYLPCCHHPTAGGSVGVFGVVMTSFQLQLSLHRWRTHKKRRIRQTLLATRETN